MLKFWLIVEVDPDDPQDHPARVVATPQYDEEFMKEQIIELKKRHPGRTYVLMSADYSVNSIGVTLLGEKVIRLDPCEP